MEKIDKYIIAAIMTSTVSIIVLLVNIFQNRRNTYINTITNSRIKWMGELRGYISEFISFAYHSSMTPENVKTIKLLESKITLHLNYNGDRDNEIIKIIKTISNTQRDYIKYKLEKHLFDEWKINRLAECESFINTGKMDDHLKLLVEKSQEYLKIEWEKVKAESKDGDLKSREKLKEFFKKNKWLLLIIATFLISFLYIA